MCCVAFYFKNTLSIESRKKEQMSLKVFFQRPHRGEAADSEKAEYKTG